uniref:coiled-coil domain-containing protein 28A-like n=1 Tax=Ciona intestinalis TaxID=7719 RepID=UPI00006A4DFB|nr:coiled-coil domain-containing protein 28A-like [Ciona intestinalis]|eukprot:XP_026689877.1 coiled-coil domain-containing protein 28A-like [Ciona intestinalis]
MSASRDNSLVLNTSNTDISGHTKHDSNCSFLVDLADIQLMKKDLKELLASFRGGKLKAFGELNTIQQMENIRAMQGKLARLHFGLDSQVNYDEMDDSPDIAQVQENNMDTLLQKLDDLSGAIRPLNTSPTSPVRSIPPQVMGGSQ